VITGVSTSGVTQEATAKPTAHQEKPHFIEILQRAVNTTNQQLHEADSAAKDFAVGQAQSIHETMITMEKADLSLRLLTQVRNKAVEAYQEVIRMQM
jgi:flagellar hook-basal body complex protein FliE